MGFSLGIQSILESVGPSCMWQAWYLDDGLLFGTRQQLATSMSTLQEAFTTLGLEVNKSKCELWGPLAGTQDTGAMEAFPTPLEGLRRLPLTSGFTVLGGPVELPGEGKYTSIVWLQRL